jgi:3-oxoadipate enol-lactonase
MPHVPIEDIQLAFTDVGSGNPVVLIHGYPFNRSLWTEQATALSKKHRVVVPDLRGFGETDTGSAAASMQRMALDVKLLMDHLNLDRAVIGGLSMGGYVALAFYKHHPERVAGMVLANTRAEADSPESKTARREQAEKALAAGMASIADSMLPKLLTPDTVSKRPDLVKRIRDMMLRTNPAGAAAALLGMANREDTTDLLSEISVPALIIAGRDDALIPPQHSYTMHERINGSRLVLIDHAAHVVNLEQTEDFNRELLKFVNEINPK